MMDPARWERMWALYEEVAKRPKEDWLPYLRATCPDDAELRAQVQELLATEVPSDSFLEAAPGLPPPPQPETDTLIGESIGPYRIMARLGGGGMGVVYEAEQERPIRRRVALKLMRQGFSSPELLARFESERQALALVSHGHIAKVFDVGATDDGRPFFVMERVEGPRITDYCDEQRLTIRQRLELFLPVCDAVQHAHQKGILHRDLKPSNIVVATDNGQPRPIIIDFGVSKLLDPGFARATAHTRTGSFLGTPEYMSPEQWETPGDVDSRADVYSLGVILYELLTGSLPLELRGKSLSEAWRIQREQEPERPSTRVSTLGEKSKEKAAHRRLRPEAFRRELAGDLDWIVMRALEKERGRRYGAASELAADVERHLGDHPVLAGPPSRLYRARKFTRRHRVGVAAAIAFGAALLAGLVGTLWMARQAIQARDETQREAAVAQATSDFLERMLSAPNPSSESSQGGTETKVRDVLDQAAADLDSAFADQPLVEAKLQRTLGRSYDSLGDLESAERHLRRAIELYRASQAVHDPKTLEAQLQLAGLLGMYGSPEDLSEAVELARAVVEIRRQMLGDTAPETLDAMTYLAEALSNSGPSGDAERQELFEEVLEVFRRELEPGFTEDPLPLQTLAETLHDEAEFRRAAPLFQEILERRRKVLGPDHPASREALQWTGYMGSQTGDLETTVALRREVLDTASKDPAASDWDILAARRGLGMSLMNLGRLSEAETHLREAVAGMTEHLGPSHKQTLGTQSVLAKNLRRQGRLEEAETLLRQIIATAEETYSGDHPSAPRFRHRLGDLLSEQGRFEEAESELLASFRALNELQGPYHHLTEESRTCLIEFYEARGQTDRANEFRVPQESPDPEP